MKDQPLTRPVVAYLVLAALSAATAGTRQPGAGPPDNRAIISRADLVYERPVPRSEEGMPLGNGRMGSLVWTTPAALKFQINRVDIQPISSGTNSFFERNSDYMGGAGLVDIELAGAGPDVFPDDGTHQRLSVYDAQMNVQGRGVSARLLAWHERDVMAIEVNDHRGAPEPIQVNLRMLRFASQYFADGQEKLTASRSVTIRTRHHTASSRLSVHGSRIVLSQEFREGTHVAKSAVAIAVVGRAVTPRFADETEDVRRSCGCSRTAMGKPRHLHP